MSQSIYTPTPRQKLVAWMLLGGMLFFELLSYFGWKFIFGHFGYGAEIFNKVVLNVMYDLLLSASALLLALSAHNFSGRLLGYVIMGFSLFDIFFVFLPIYGVVFWALYIFIRVTVVVWLLSVLLRNNPFSATARTWGNLLIVLKLVSLAWMTYLIASPRFESFTVSSGNSIFRLFVALMMAFCWWHIARSEAFSGNYDRLVRISLAPGLKHLLAIGIGFLLMLLWVLFIYGVS